MLRKIRNYFFMEEAELAASDIAVLALLGVSLLLAGYAIYQMGGF